MKVYLAKGIYYEMQADAKKADKGFETVDFPFAASPKSDFVGWLNGGNMPRADIDLNVDRNDLLDEVTWKPSEPMVVRAGPPTPEVIAADKEATSKRLQQIDVEEAIQSAELPALATYASNVAWRFSELAKTK